MNTADFEVSQTYSIKLKDWTAPTGEVVPGEVKVRKILPPISAQNRPVGASDLEVQEWSKMLRVWNADRGAAHLIHPDSIASATES
ncbi:hypothetical protein [Marinobacterium sp. BA1]|uniref:hypothetical protein n=1 Tax=Marinobacterium sp. BA1 TaxID=3138931 RepID=UPI0032E6B4EB